MDTAAFVDNRGWGHPPTKIVEVDVQGHYVRTIREYVWCYACEQEHLEMDYGTKYNSPDCRWHQLRMGDTETNEPGYVGSREQYTATVAMLLGVWGVPGC